MTNDMNEWLLKTLVDLIDKQPYVLSDRHMKLRVEIELSSGWQELNTDLKNLGCFGNGIKRDLVVAMQRELIVAFGVELAAKCPILLPMFCDLAHEQNLLADSITLSDLQRLGTTPNDIPDWMQD